MRDRNHSFLPHECSAEQTDDAGAGIASLPSGLGAGRFSEVLLLTAFLRLLTKPLLLGRHSFSALRSVSYITVGESFSFVVP